MTGVQTCALPISLRYEIFRLDAVDGLERLPYCLKVLAENLLRTEDGANVTADHVRALAAWDPAAEPDTEIQFTPARVIMQYFMILRTLEA